MPRMVSSAGRGSFSFPAGAGDPWAILDGRLSAAAGTIQYPNNLLNGYVKRPPWQSAGVDYHAGVADVLVLTPWQSLSGTGISVNTTTKVVTVSGTSNTDLNGVDFSDTSSGGGQGASISFQNCTGWKVRNSKFGGTNLRALSAGIINTDASSSGGEITNCTVDGGGGPSTCATLVFARGTSGTFKIWNNYLKSLSQHLIENVDGASVDIRYNLIEGGAKSWKSHYNLLQFSSGSVASAIFKFNTVIAVPTVAGGEGPQFYFNSSGSMATAEVTFNTYLTSATLSGVSARQNNQAYVYGDVITVPGGACSYYFCVQDGTSNASQPSLYATLATDGPTMVGSISGTVLTVSAGVLYAVAAVGQILFGAVNALTANTKITSLGTGSGDAGTYNINNSQSVGSQQIYGAIADGTAAFVGQNKPMSNIIHGGPVGVGYYGSNYVDLSGATSLYYSGSMATGWQSLGADYNMMTGAPITPS